MCALLMLTPRLSIVSVIILPIPCKLSKIEGDALNKGGGVIQVNYEVGFYVVVLLFLAAAALHIFVLLRGKGLPLPALTAGGGNRFCTQCGSRNLSTDAFCKECGAKFA